MADSQILVAGSSAAPLSYTVPNAQEMTTLAISAEFDGSGAAAAFLPMIEILSDAGIVIARSPTAEQVAAGASADVSWFPRLSRQAAAGAALAWGLGYNPATFPFNDAISVPSGGTVNFPWTNPTTGGTAITFTDGANPSDTLTLTETGVYLFAARVAWDSVVTGAYQRWAGFETLIDGAGFATASTRADGSFIYTGQVSLQVESVAPTSLNFFCHNADPANAHQVLGGILTAVKLGELA